MNELDWEKRSEIKRLLAAGCSTRQIEVTVGCSRQTVTRYARMWKVSATCGCGKPGGHNGWCHVRLDFSPSRRGWLAERWGKRGQSELRETVDLAIAAAQEHGHQLGPFIWGGWQSASIAYAQCLVCQKTVRVFTGDNQWSKRFEGWERFAGTATREQCKTDEQRAAEKAAREDKKSWRDGQRSLNRLRSHLRRRASIPERSSHL